MVYKITKTDGTELTQIPDGKLDSTTSIDLIGRNSVNFGESLNENFVKLLENFASTSSPSRPIRGQLWYDTSTGRLNVYDGNGFRVTGGPIVSPIQPNNLVTGDLWINNQENQMFFFDGSDLILAGPGYSNSQGKTGLESVTLIDRVTGQGRTVSALYVGGILIGIFSSVEFTPLVQIDGYGDNTKIIRKGFNTPSTFDFNFDVTASNAKNLVLNSGVIKTVDQVVFKDLENTLTEPLNILANDAMKLGPTNQGRLYVTENDLTIENTINDRSIIINVKDGILTTTAMLIRGANKRIGIWNSNPQYNVDLTGSLRVTGDLIVGGETVSLETNNIVTKDKSIELNYSDDGSNPPTDTTASGGGIILKATTDKTILYNLASDAWNISENVNLSANKSYKINDTAVIEPHSTISGEFQLGPTLTRAPNLVEIGSLTSLNAGQVSITTNIISTPLNTDMRMDLQGNGNFVFTSGGQIKGIDAPTATQDATNKLYTDTLVYSKPMSLSLDITGLKTYTGDDDNAAIAEILDVIAPYYDLVFPQNTPNGAAAAGTRLVLHCVTTEIVNQGFTSPTVNLSTTNVISADGSTIIPVLNNVFVGAPGTAVSTINKKRRNKLFIMGGGTNPQIGKWGFDSDLGAEYTTTE
jgi:hypothetical protein